MATNQQIANVHDNPGNGFLARIRASIAKQAQYILSAELPAVENHANRELWARYVLASDSGMEAMLASMLWCISANNDVVAAVEAGGLPTDETLDYVVGVSINMFATGAL